MQWQLQMRNERGHWCSHEESENAVEIMTDRNQLIEVYGHDPCNLRIVSEEHKDYQQRPLDE